MVIQTNHGEFGSFADLEIYMRQEQLDTIELLDVSYWGAHVLYAPGTYTYQQIQDILTS